MVGLVVVGAVAGWRLRVARPESRYERARAAIAVKDWDGADWYAERLAAAGRDDLHILVRAEMAYQRGDAAAALERLAAFPETGDRAEAALLVARCLTTLNRLEDAARTYDLAIRLKPESAEAYRGAAQLAYNIGQLGMAVYFLERLIKLDTVDGKPARLLGDIQADLGRFDEAASAYEIALARSLDPNLLDTTYRSRASVLGSSRRYDEMLAVCDAAKRRGSAEDAEWATLRGEALWGGGQLSQAREVVEAGLKASPKSPPLLSLLAQLELHDGRPESAVAALERALERPPRAYPQVLLLSQAYAAAGRKADADRIAREAESLRKDMDLITELTKAADLRPWDAGLRLEMADVCERLGNREMAAKWREIAGMMKK